MEDSEKGPGAVVVSRLMAAFNCRSQAALARRLGVAPQTVSGWIVRGQPDHALVIEKLSEADVSLEWVFLGIGPMRRSERTAPDLEILEDDLTHREVIELDSPEAWDAVMSAAGVQRAEVERAVGLLAKMLGKWHM